MKKLSLTKTIFSFWILLILMSSLWLIHIFYSNIDLFSSNLLILFALVVAAISFTLSIYFISIILYDLRIEINKDREKQKNIDDIYGYNQVVEPPSMYN